MNPDPLENRWAIKKVISDREIRKDTEERTVLMKVQYNDGPTKWMTIDELQIVDPYLAINHAMTHDLMYQQEYSWVQTYLDFDEEVVEMVQAYKAAAKIQRSISLVLKFLGALKGHLRSIRRMGIMHGGNL